MKNVSKFAFVGMFFVSAIAMAQSPMLKTEAKKAPMAAPTAPSVDAKKPAPAVKWEETTFNFGDIKKGVPVTHDFTFTNTTKETILITNVKPSCGCTATNYTKTPIKPGEKGSISAKYDARSGGPFSKSITVNLNENTNPIIISIKGKVLEDELPITTGK
jgi:hypothetical protein